MKTQFLLVIILITTLFSCKKRSINGHWHEYKIGDLKYFNSYKISDSTIRVNSYSHNGVYIRGTEIKKSEIISMTNNNYYSLSDINISKKIIKLDDSIIWIKQQNTDKVFIQDFSAGLLVKIHPYELEQSRFDFTINEIEQLYGHKIFVGKSTRSNEFLIQLNDILSNEPNDLKEFLSCHHCDYKKETILLHIHKDTPKELTSKIYDAIIDRDIYGRSLRNSSQIYFLVADIDKKTVGYKKFKLNELK